MTNSASTSFWVTAIVLAAAVMSLLWTAFFSRRARQRRRQRGGYGRVRDRRHGPAVQLNLKVKHEKERRK